MSGVPRTKVTNRKTSRMNDLPFYLAGIYYEFMGLIERSFEVTGLNQHLRPGMGSVLLALFEEDDCIIKNLVNRLQMANATLTGLLQSMDKAGLIERYRCPEDGRATRVKLTSFGSSLEDQMVEAHYRAISILQANLSKQESTELKRLLEEILDCMRLDRRQWKLERRLKGKTRSS